MAAVQDLAASWFLGCLRGPFVSDRGEKYFSEKAPPSTSLAQNLAVTAEIVRILLQASGCSKRSCFKRTLFPPAVVFKCE